MSAPATTPSPFTRANPYKACVSQNYLLTGPGSNKETRHIVVNLGESGINYTPGDSLGVLPRNIPYVVDELIAKLGLDPATPVTFPAAGSTAPFRKALIDGFIINRVNQKFVKAVLEKLPEGEQKTKLAEIIASKEAFEEYTFTRDFVDVLNEYAVSFTAEEFIALPSKVLPRLYSIASSHKAHPGEVHLTVAVVMYTTHNRPKLGLASGFLGQGLALNTDEVAVYIQPTKHFHMPAPDKNIIMVGPGTGIAPFRAFIEQRALEGGTGKSWLFFGDQKKSTDFLYEKEFEDYIAKGVLTRLDTAFSRDQEKKVYVQDRMRENGAEFWDWLQNGAYFYICGDAKRMAKDVHQTLIEMAQEHGKLTPEAAKEYIEITLTKTEKRYLKDVY